MKKIVLLYLGLFAVIGLNAQERKVKNNLMKINVLSPGLNFEKGIGNTTTISSDISTSLGLYGSSSSNKFLISPYIKEQYRFYYNFENREQKGKNISNNSANFIALSASYYFKPIGNSNYLSVYDGLTVGPVWGLQRTYNCGLNIIVNTGVGYNISSENGSKIVPVINFSLGWVIGK